MNIHVARRKGSASLISKELELELQAPIASNIEVTNITHCTGYEEILKQLELLYGIHESDLDTLLTQFQNFRFNKEISVCENVN